MILKCKIFSLFFLVLFSLPQTVQAAEHFLFTVKVDFPRNWTDPANWTELNCAYLRLDDSDTATVRCMRPIDRNKLQSNVAVETTVFPSTTKSFWVSYDTLFQWANLLSVFGPLNSENFRIAKILVRGRMNPNIDNEEKKVHLFQEYSRSNLEKWEERYSHFQFLPLTEPRHEQHIVRFRIQTERLKF